MSSWGRSFLSLLAATTILAAWLGLVPHSVTAGGTANLAITLVGDAKHLKYGNTKTFTLT